jgi:pilus assembly protein CpaE
VDLAPLGHAALHLNVKPLFTIADALRNLHRMDGSLLESFMTRHPDGLHLLAGTSTPTSIEPTTGEFAALFDILVSHYRYIVVDTSTRLDAATRLVCNLSEYVLLVAHTDVASLWSAARVLQYLGDTGGRERVRLVLNRFRKIPGFSENDAEAATGLKLLWKIPNQYVAVSNSIDRGVPVIQQNHSEVARSFAGLAAALTEADEGSKRTGWSLFKTV